MSDIEIRALSLLQPWASLLVFGEKKVETRSWRTSYRGPVAIHASLNDKFIGFPHFATEPFLSIFYPHSGLPPEEYDALTEEEQNQIEKDLFENSFEKKVVDFYGGRTMKMGYVIGIGKLVDCVPTSQIKAELSDKEISLGDYSEGMWAWKFEGMRPIKPIGMKGALGLRRIYLPEEVVHG